MKAAEQGLTEAQFKVADTLELGRGVKADPQKAAGWFEQIIKQGENREVRYRLAMLHLNDQSKQAIGVNLLRQTAELGHAAAQYQLGYLYGQGKAVIQDYEQAVFWYTRAARQQIPDAQFLLCLSYSLGKGVPVDILRAHVWCEAAVKNNVAGADEALKTIKDSMTAEQLLTAEKLAPMLNPH